VRRALPGAVMLRERLRRRDTSFRDHAFESREPMMVVGFSRVWIAGRLRLLDLLANNRLKPSNIIISVRTAAGMRVLITKKRTRCQLLMACRGLRIVGQSNWFKPDLIAVAVAR
jgi:hypothetical protein